jgi:hypothetical protein
VFRLHGSTVAAGRRAFHFPGRRIDERFSREGSYFLGVAWLAFVRAAQLGSARGGSQAWPHAKFGAPVRLVGCLVGASFFSLASQVRVLRRRERTF